MEKFVEELLNAGADINQRDNVLNINPLEMAKKQGFLEIIEILKEHGANES